MRPIDLFQGADRTIEVKTRTDLTSATEIEFTIDTVPQIAKTLSGGGISAVTATQFNVAIAAGDTRDIKSGEYRYQARSTFPSGIVTHSAQQDPPLVKINDSIFTNVE